MSLSYNTFKHVFIIFIYYIPNYSLDTLAIACTENRNIRTQPDL